MSLSTKPLHKNATLSLKQLDAIVREITPKHLQMPDIMAQTYYMLLELNIHYE